MSGKNLNASTSQLSWGVDFILRQVAPRQFWGGSFNLTAKEFKSVCSKHEFLLLVLTAQSCRHCIDFEPAYRLVRAGQKATIYVICGFLYAFILHHLLQSRLLRISHLPLCAPRSTACPFLPNSVSHIWLEMESTCTRMLECMRLHASLPQILQI